MKTKKRKPFFVRKENGKYVPIPTKELEQYLAELLKKEKQNA
jgi:hypothetical protein